MKRGTWQWKIERLCGVLGLRVTSGFRTPRHNAEIGGSPTSFHLKGTREEPGAVDAAGIEWKMALLFEIVRICFHGHILELFYDPKGKVKRNQFSSIGIGGHSDHVHIAIGD